MPERDAASASSIGVDVGGSAIKLGSLDAEGSVLDERSLSMPEDLGAADPAPILDGIVAAVTELAGGTPRGVGVGLPGLLDRERGLVSKSPNLPFLAGLHVRAELARRLGIDESLVRIENDANVAALGELRFGAARGRRHVLLLTLGTGIGGGLVLDGELFVGEGLAGEIGHVTIAPDGPPCGCGSHGCLETLASASAARRRALALGLPAERPGDLELLSERARDPDTPEADLLHAIGIDLGHALAQVVCLLDLRHFVFGGGFAAALDGLAGGIRRGLSEWAYGERVAGVTLERATLGAAAGWIGAACLNLPHPSQRTDP